MMKKKYIIKVKCDNAPVLRRWSISAHHRYDTLQEAVDEIGELRASSCMWIYKIVEVTERDVDEDLITPPLEEAVKSSWDARGVDWYL